MRKKIIIFSVLLFFIIASLIFIVTKNVKKTDAKISSDNAQKINYESVRTNTKDKVVVLPTAKITMTQLYKECGHKVTEEFSVPEDIVNMTEQELKKYYYGWNVELFSEKNIKIYKENRGICEEHYIVRDVDGFVTVFRKDDNNEEILVLATQSNTKYLPVDDREKLLNGICIVGKENLSKLLEDYE